MLCKKTCQQIRFPFFSAPPFKTLQWQKYYLQEVDFLKSATPAENSGLFCSVPYFNIVQRLLNLNFSGASPSIVLLRLPSPILKLLFTEWFPELQLHQTKCNQDFSWSIHFPVMENLLAGLTSVLGCMDLVLQIHCRNLRHPSFILFQPETIISVSDVSVHSDGHLNRLLKVWNAW